MIKLSSLFPGFFLSFIIFIFSHFLSGYIGTEILGYSKSPISTALFAILIGILIGNTFKIEVYFSKGLNFSLKFILRLGIVLLGIRLSLSDVVIYGAKSVPLIIICFLFVIITIFLLVRFFKISPSMSYLIAIGTSICGASAIVATAPVINAQKAEVTYSIANITLFGIAGMFAYPFLAHYLFSGDVHAIGLFLGTAIHETAQVAAAGLIYEQQFNNSRALEISTITKLVRNTFLIVMIPLFAYFYSRHNVSGTYSVLKVFPVFVLGFVIMVITRSVGDHFITGSGNEFLQDAWPSLINILKYTSYICLGIAMSALGLMTNLKELQKMGYKPFLVGFTAAIMVGGASFITISIFKEIGFF